jgi:hypothetical protein
MKKSDRFCVKFEVRKSFGISLVLASLSSVKIVSCLLPKLLLPVAIAWAVESVASAAEVDLLLFEIAETYEQGKARPAEAAEELWELASEAMESHADQAWSQAILHVVRLGLLADTLPVEEDEPELIVDAPELLQQVINKTSKAADRAQRLEAYELLAQVYERRGEAPAAARTLEKAAAQAQDGNMTSTASRVLLAASEIRARLGHTAKLRANWARLEALKALPLAWTEEVAARRAEHDELLVLWPDTISTVGALLQPSQHHILTAAQAHEDGVGVVHLVHQGVTGLAGQLECTVAGAKVESWSAGADGVLIQLGKGDPETLAKPFYLLPLQDVRITVLAAPEVAAAAQVTLRWQGENEALLAKVDFTSTRQQEASALLGESILTQQPGLPLPVMHHLYYRGIGSQVQNSFIKASRPARLEVYDQDSGELLAIDAEGDGLLNGPNDFLANKGNADGNAYLDAQRSEQCQLAAWEVYALPLQASPEPVALQFFLAENGKWVPQGADSILRP